MGQRRYGQILTTVTQHFTPSVQFLNVSVISLMSAITFAVGCVGGRPVMVGVLCSVEGVRGRLFVKSVCGGVERRESGVSGVGGEYADWETAGT